MEVFWFSKKIKHHTIRSLDIRSIETFKTSGGSINGKDMGDKFDLIIKYSQAGRLNIGGDFKTLKNATHMKMALERVFNLESLV